MEGYLTEIRYWGPTWSPRNWASCSGQLLPISSYNAVFSLIGTIYGGDGRTTFRLPDLRGRVSVGAGHGIGLTPRSNGQASGSESVGLSLSQLPAHNHNSTLAGSVAISANVSNQPGTATSASAGSSIGAEAAASSFFYNNETPNTALNASSMTVNNSLSEIVSNNGSSDSHFNMQPYEVILPIICLSGIYPSRN